MTSFADVVSPFFVIIVPLLLVVGASLSQPIVKCGVIADKGVLTIADKRLFLLLLLPIAISGILSIFLFNNDTSDGDGGDVTTIFRRDLLGDDADRDNDIADPTLSTVAVE